MFRLDGKRALVTGATGGIGEAIARRLCAAGATVLATGTRAEKLAGLADELGAKLLTETGDLADPAAPDRLVAAAETRLGGLDILVNNAGITRDMLALRMKDADWQAVLDVDLTACFRLARAALKGMLRRRAGRIVTITSVVGVTGNAGQANYAAAKAGLIGMSKALALEVAERGITVNCVAPGFIVTPMTDGLNEAQQAVLLARIPQRRLGAAGDVAAAVAYLASDDAAYVTGQTLHVNGGMAMP
ncbi:MAG: 3-oxoacyl-[acyl-carrier-protein] reductase [Alphaproteobacteria bacterium]|nr:3-oxoacyl-[acyl-carrier-protein] reductase [Alphaproteobacteria bacterium]